MSYSDLRDFDAELVTYFDEFDVTVLIEKAGGGTVGNSYAGKWSYQVNRGTLELASGNDLETGTPHTHAQAARLVLEFLTDDSGRILAPVYLVHPEREATRIGTEHGKSVASWFPVDSVESARAVIAADDECELSDHYRSPLSGEYADDYSADALFTETGLAKMVDTDSDWDDNHDVNWTIHSVVQAYEDAHYAAWQTEVVRRANYYLDDDDSLGEILSAIVDND